MIISFELDCRAAPDICFSPRLQEHANQTKGSRVRSGQRQHPKPASAKAEEHLLTVRHTKLSPRSPQVPGNSSKSRAASTTQMQSGHSKGLRVFWTC